MVPRMVSAMSIAPTITIAWPLWDRLVRSFIFLSASVLRDHRGGRGDPEQVGSGAAEERGERVVAIDDRHDDREAALVLRTGIFGRTRTGVAGRWTRAEGVARGGAAGVDPRAAVLVGIDADGRMADRGVRAVRRRRFQHVGARAEPAEHADHRLVDTRAREAAAAVRRVHLGRARARTPWGAKGVVRRLGVGHRLPRTLPPCFPPLARRPVDPEQVDGQSEHEEKEREYQRKLDERLALLQVHQYSLRWKELTVMGICEPTIGQSSGVMIFMVLVRLAVTESEPGSNGPPPLAVALVTAEPLRQWNVIDSVDPASTEPAGGPLLELSSAASLAMVEMGPPARGLGELTVTASAPLLVPAQTLSALACWAGDTATRVAYLTGLATA